MFQVVVFSAAFLYLLQCVLADLGNFLDWAIKRREAEAERLTGHWKQPLWTPAGLIQRNGRENSYVSPVGRPRGDRIPSKARVNHFGSSRTLAALDRLFWVSYGVWALLVTYIGYTSNSLSGIAIFLFLLMPALLRYLVVFIVSGKLR